MTAVSRAGGLGCLAASWTPVRVLREQIAAVRRAHDGPFCVNLVLDFDQSERLEVLAEERVPAVSFSWGVDAAAIRRLRGAGATVLAQVADAGAARAAAGAGANMLIAQGVEAGGHVQSRAPLLAVVREVAAATPLPVLAAGGIADAASVTAARAAGAVGIAVGTVFLAAREADVHPLYRERVIAAQAGDTLLTSVFDVGWPHAPHRVLRNSTIAAWEAAGSPPPGARPGEGEPVAARFGHPIVRYADAQPTADTTGDVEAMALYAGTGVGAVGGVEPAAEITARLLYRSYE